MFREKKDKPRRSRRTPSWQEKLTAKAFEWLMEAAVNDPLVRDAVIAKYAGVDPTQVDRDTASKQRIKSFLLEEAIKEIRNNKKLRDTLVRAEMFKLMEMEDPELKPKPPQPDPFDVWINKIKKFREVEDLLKPKTSWDDVIKGGLMSLTSLVMSMQGFQAADTISRSNGIISGKREIGMKQAAFNGDKHRDISQLDLPKQDPKCMDSSDNPHPEVNG